ncbi:MAG: TraR/DksA family transcriptional regulator [Candidatus Brocadiales bacterium]
MKEKEINDFKKILLERRERLLGNVNTMHDETLTHSGQSACGDLSNVPIHMADVGTDNYERDLMIDLIQNGEETVRSMDTALEKIEEGTFGVCEVCQKKINKTRLVALPQARLCIDCQRKEETEGSTG